MPDNPRLVLVSSSVFGKAIEIFKPRVTNMSVPAEFKVNNLTLRDIGTDLEGDITVSQPYFYLDESYPQIVTQLGRAAKTIWLNEDGEIAPGEWPVQDVDITSLEALGNLGASLRNPTLDQCRTWWDEWDLPENIRRHVKKVAQSAYVLAVLLRREGIEVDPILTHRGGLMHDIDKIETLNQVMGHGEMGGDFFDEQGYPELAEIVRGHIMHTILKVRPEERRWEDSLVYFCDKLVEGDRLVPFNYRLDQLKIRYPHYRGPMEAAEPYIWALSDKICSILSLSSHEHLIRKVKETIKS